jgi:hypothetical protein
MSGIAGSGSLDEDPLGCVYHNNIPNLQQRVAQIVFPLIYA